MDVFHYLHRGAGCRIVILVIQGGNSPEIARHHRQHHADLVLVIDVEKELARLLPAVLPPHVKCYALGVGHTARTLAAGSPAIQNALANTAGMNAEEGLGQLRARTPGNQTPARNRPNCGIPEPGVARLSRHGVRRGPRFRTSDRRRQRRGRHCLRRPAR